MKENLRKDYIAYDGTLKDIKKYYAEKIQASEKVRIDINKSSDPFEMLDFSLLCIYFLTGDKSFYKQNRDKLIKFIAEYNYKSI